MSTIIVFTSSHGATEKNAKILKEKLADENVTLCHLKKDKCDLTNFDKVIIGCSIHAGSVQGKIKKFCRSHTAELTIKQLGIFITCMEEGEEANQYFEKNFPNNLLEHAKTTALFGGEFNFEKMNFFAKSIVKKITGYKETVSRLDENKIAEFAKNFEA